MLRLLVLLLALAGCAGTNDRCAEAAAIYDTLPERTAVDAGLVVVACM
ncbi:hypothetical protein [Thauera sp.]|nr:hypothetical protein [Thauera sp.]HRP26359.1 hypothetical protein [Thauera sp.]